jgi:RNA polymerase sigma factor (sigma-70 family)
MISAMTEPREVTDHAEDLAAVYARFHRDVFRYCLVMTRSVEDAEDVAGEVFERGLRAWGSGHEAAGPPLPWLLLVARRILIDRSRRRSLLRWIPLLVGHVSRAPQVDADRVEFWLWFDRLAEALTPRQREVLLLRYQSDLSDVDIGRILGLSEAGVRSLASRAIAALRQHPELLQ